MNNKYLLLILGFALGIFTSSMVYFYISFIQKTSISTSIQLSDESMSEPTKNIHSMNDMMKEYSDLEFLNLMIIHHQDAIDMSQRALINSNNQFIRNLSQSIINVQKKEINEMKIEIDKIINIKK
jgi:uncharacterized protein (DUF305 family)